MSGQALAIYDFDGTMIRGDSIAAYLLYAFRRRMLPLSALLTGAACALLHRCGLISAGQAKQRALRFLARIPAADRADMDTAFAQSLSARICPAALRQMQDDRRDGKLIVLLSASTDNYMAPLGQLIGVDQLICTRLSDLPDGNCRGRVKAERLHAWLDASGIVPDFAASAAYADSASDAPVLDLVGSPRLIDPSARTRRRLAGRYPILRWF